MKTFFNQLFDYNFDCNKKIIVQCGLMDKAPNRSLVLFSHILNAHHIWNARIWKKKPEYQVFQGHDVADWDDIHYENQRSSFEIMTKEDALDRRIDYENTAGDLFTNSLEEILFHIINHSAHHRGQINLDFRQNGLEPFSLDYIFYKRHTL